MIIATVFLTMSSLSEYGCNKNERKFEEVASLYGSEMTPVYSGGLVYEYSQEESNYGLVELNGDSAPTERADFGALKSAFAGTKAPSGDGGYKSSGSASECPAKSDTWDVSMNADTLPVLPDGADELFKNGCGAGPGLKGDGSQTAGTATVQLGGAVDGAVTSGASAPSSSTSKGAAATLRAGELSFAPFVCGAIVLVSSLIGGTFVL